MKALLIFISLFYSLDSDSSKVRSTEVPVFKVNFYLMGQEEINQELTIQIGENIDYLNQEFEGRVKFELNQLVMDPNQAYIPDLHAQHLSKDRSRIDHLIDPIEQAGAINIYLFDTYTTEDGLSAMLGFTPILSTQHNKYKLTSPQFDRLFISYTGLMDKSTIVHEMGHFLGLRHPWEMETFDLDKMGLYVEGTDNNHMTYDATVDHFSKQQLDKMRDFALDFRSYLISHIEVTMITETAFVKTATPRFPFR